MSSISVEKSAGYLLECGMDFRTNWLAHFKAIVDAEIKAAGGSAPAGRAAVGQKLEKDEQTIYQHYTQKSGKVYPTAAMMVLLEKKYGAGRPPGWAALPIDDGTATPSDPVEPWDSVAATEIRPANGGVRYVVKRLASYLEPLDPTDRKQAGVILDALVDNPSNADEIAGKLSRLLGESPIEQPVPLSGQR